MNVGVLIVAAVGCLAAGLALKLVLLTWIALAACGLGLAVIAGTVIVPRRPWEIVPGLLRTARAAAVSAVPEEPAAEPEPETTRESETAREPGAGGRVAVAVLKAVGIPEASPDRPPLEAESVVCVVPRRTRYHRPGCRLLARHVPRPVLGPLSEAGGMVDMLARPAGAGRAEDPAAAGRRPEGVEPLAGAAAEGGPRRVRERLPACPSGRAAQQRPRILI